MVKPILFNEEMVNAILEGRKTVTRRKINADIVEALLNSQYKKTHPEMSDAHVIKKLCRAPYETGDFLYVRETWCKIGFKNGPQRYVFKATDTYPFGETYIIKFRWHPSIHMPKEAARIFLRVTDVRVERLRNITVKEVKKEGCGENLANTKFISPVCHFMEVWNSTIKKSDKKRYGWNANPYVWVIEFERCEKPEE